MTQRAWVERQLLRYRILTTVDATRHYILRLGSIICRLRQKGWNIRTKTPAGKRYAKYILISRGT